MNNRIFEPENELESALIKATKDMNYWSRFYKIFLESDIFVFINKEPPSEEKMFIVTEKTEVEFIARKIGEKADLNLAELDLYLWYIETGKVLK